MSNTKPVGTGGRFPPGTSVERLRGMHRGERNRKASVRLLACVMRRDGMSIREICAGLSRPYPTVRNRPVRVAEGGTRKRHDAKMPGTGPKMGPKRPRALRGDLVAGPQGCGFGSGVWTAPLPAEHVCKRYGARHAACSICDILHRMGLSPRGPGPGHPKSAPEPEKEAFKKKPGHA